METLLLYNLFHLMILPILRPRARGVQDNLSARPFVHPKSIAKTKMPAFSPSAEETESRAGAISG